MQQISIHELCIMHERLSWSEDPRAKAAVSKIEEHLIGFCEGLISPKRVRHMTELLKESD